MQKFNITFHNTKEKEVLEETVGVEVLTFAEAAREAYLWRAARSLDWEIVSITRSPSDTSRGI